MKRRELPAKRADEALASHSPIGKHPASRWLTTGAIAHFAWFTIEALQFSPRK
jgi:hypothetical protein